MKHPNKKIEARQKQICKRILWIRANSCFNFWVRKD